MVIEQTAYEILRVPETASADEITEAYQQRLRDFHPDLNEGDKEWIKDLDDAYAKVGTKTRRRAYDEWLAKKRAKAKEEAERVAAAAAAEAASEPPSAPPPETPMPTLSMPVSPSRPRPIAGPPAAGRGAADFRGNTPGRSRDSYKRESYGRSEPRPHVDLGELFMPGLAVIVWWFVFTEGFADFKVWWNPVAWIPVIWWFTSALVQRPNRV